MVNPYELLGVASDASEADLKTAYHRQLRQFPAHSHPQEFQQIRAAYETIRQAATHQGDPLRPAPLLGQLDPEALAALDSKVRQSCALTLQDLLLLTF